MTCFEGAVHWFRDPPEDVCWAMGNFPGGDPRDFKPNGDDSFVEEISRWMGDCVRFEILERRGLLAFPESGAHVWTGAFHIALGKYGHGIYWFEWKDDDDGGVFEDPECTPAIPVSVNRRA